jgi:hypothetical protein
MASSNGRNRSETLTLSSPRGPVEVVRQQWRSQKSSSRWELERMARRSGQRQWRQATSAREAIRQATLLAAGKQSAWLPPAAAQAERELRSVDEVEASEVEEGGDAA